MAAGASAYEGDVPRPRPWVPRAFALSSGAARSSQSAATRAFAVSAEPPLPDPSLAPITSQAASSTIANMATKIVKAKGAQQTVDLGNGRTRVLAGGNGNGNATASSNAGAKRPTEKDKEKDKEKASGQTRPPWRSYFNYTKPETGPGSKKASEAKSPGRSRSSTRNEPPKRTTADSGTVLHGGMGGNEDLSAYNPTEEALSDAERFRRRVAEIQSLRARQRQHGPGQEDDFEFDYADYFRSPGGTSTSAAGGLRSHGQLGTAGASSIQTTAADTLRNSTVNGSEIPGSRVQKHLFASKSPGRTAATGTSPGSASLLYPRHELAMAQPSFASVEDNFATFQYDPSSSTANYAPSKTQALHVPPMASPPAARPHTTQNSPYRPDPMSPPFRGGQTPARSATAVGFAPTATSAPTGFDLPPRPEEYNYRAPARGPATWESTAIGRPTPLRPLESLSPRSVEIQPPCFHSLQARLQTLSAPSGPWHSHIGFLLGRVVVVSDQGPKLLLDRFDVGRREARESVSSADHGERWEPTVVIKGDVVVPVVLAVPQDGVSPFGVHEWERITKTFESYMFTARSRLPSLLCPTMGIVDARALDLLFRSMVPNPQVTMTPVATPPIATATSFEDFGFLATDEAGHWVRMEEADPRLRSGGHIAGIWIRDSRDLAKAVVRFSMRRCWSRLESAPMEDPERASFVVAVVNPDREPRAWECIQIPPIMSRDKFPFAVVGGAVSCRKKADGGNVKCVLEIVAPSDFKEEGFRQFALRRWGIELPFDAPAGPPSPILPRSPRRRHRSGVANTGNLLDGLEDEVSHVVRTEPHAGHVPSVSVEPAPHPHPPLAVPAQAPTTAPVSTAQSANVSQAPSTLPFPLANTPASNLGVAELAQLQLQQQQMFMTFMSQMMARMGMPVNGAAGVAAGAAAATAAPSTAAAPTAPATLPDPAASAPAPTHVDSPSPAPTPARKVMAETATNTTVVEPRSSSSSDRPPPDPAAGLPPLGDLRSVGTNTSFVAARTTAAAAPSHRDRPPLPRGRSRFQSSDSPDQSLSDINSSAVQIGAESRDARPTAATANGQAYFEMSMPVEDVRDGESWAMSEAPSLDAMDSASNIGLRRPHSRHQSERERTATRPRSPSGRTGDTDRRPRNRSQDPAGIITELCSSDPEKSFIVVESRKLKGFRNGAAPVASSSRPSRRGPMEREDSSDESDDRASMTTEEEDIRANLIASRYLPRHSRHAPVAPASRDWERKRERERERNRPRHGHGVPRAAQLREEASMPRADMSFASLRYLQKYGLDQGL